MKHNAPTRLHEAKGSRRKLAALFVSFALAWGLASAADAALVNTATVSGTANGQPVTASATVSVDLVNAVPGLTVVKTGIVNNGGDGQDDPGDTISYSFTVTNSGNVSLTNVILADPAVTLSAPTLNDQGTTGDSNDGLLSAGWDELGPGDTLTYTATYILTNADVNAGQVVNTASASASTHQGAPVNASDTATTPLNVVSTLSLAKVATLNDGGDGIVNAGDTISYAFTVTNTGNIVQNNVSVSDPLLNVADLPGRAQAYQMMAAAAAGADPMTTASTGAAPFDPALAFEGEMRLYAPNAVERAARMIGRDVPQLAVALHAERRLVLLSGDPGKPKPGDLLGIYFELVNAGEGPLTAVTVEQQGAEAYGRALDLLPANSKDAASIIFSRTLTEADIASGIISAPATVRANSRGRTTTLALDGDMALAAVSGLEELATASITPANVPSLNPGESANFSATLVLTQADIDAGVVNNTAVATSTDSLGDTITASGSASTPIPPLPSLAVIKEGTVNAGADNIVNAGDSVTYVFRVRNTGNVTLSGITITDPLPGVVLSGGPIASLAPNLVDSTSISATYTLTQADIDAGRVDNQAQASGTAPGVGGATVTDLSDDDSDTEDQPTSVALAAAPQIALLKTLDTSTYPTAVEDVNANGLNDAGDRIHYAFAVHNTGNVTLGNVHVQDRNPAIITTPLPPTGIQLAPGASDTASFAAIYTLTQADVDAGSFNNTADAFGTDPGGTIVQDESDPGVLTGNSPTVLTIPPQPGLSVLMAVSSITDTNSNGINDAGDVIHYVLTVINNGNVTLGNVTLSNPNASISGGSLAALLPGTFDNTTFTATHTINAADMLAGRVTTQTTATASTPAGPTVTDLSDTSDPAENDPTVTPTVIQPAISVLKQVDGITNTNGNGMVDAGDTIQYRFTVRNTGNVDLSNVTLQDSLAGVTVAGGPIALMEAGDTDSTTFTASYVITAADIVAGQVVNQATARGTASNAANVSDLSDESDFNGNDPTVTYLANAPAIGLVKTVSSITDSNGNGINDAGDIINYTFTVVNTGNAALTNISITDSNATVTGGPLASLAVAATNSTTFSGAHVITAADVNAGGVTNQAMVQATGPTGAISDVSDESDPADNDPTFTSLTQVPRIALIKTVSQVQDVNGNALVDAGDVIHYAFAVHNLGNVTLANVTVTDANADMSGGPIASLAAGAVDSTTFTASHVVTLADQDAAEVLNQAQASGSDPAGGTVTDLSHPSDLMADGDTVQAVAVPPPNFTKTVAKSEIHRGERVEYTITATSLRDGPYDITDIMPPGFNFVTGTASVNGVAFTPVQSGNVLTFANLSPDPVNDRLIIKLKLVAPASLATGRHVNRARIMDTATGGILATAQVAVTIKEEHVFDCGDVIGRVFDDLNADGYANDGEPGIPGVRVVTVNGLLVTTDRNGRFHVPCADIPDAAIGSNFLMKLDPRTLPAGYRLTSENPRDVRLTRGKVTKLNFAAARDRDLALDLRREAFLGDGVDLRDEWLSGVDRLVGLLAQGRGGLSITYRCSRYAPVAATRVQVVKDLVAARWREAGHAAPLKISTRVECAP
ncbi:MAG: DUF11 domain-containing protein [Rhizobiales bacterium]|nr:DUF11 domain-containing protein [Hyphomicrobiales bacterium]